MIAPRPRVLVVDDNDINRHVLRELLDRLGLDTGEACDGAAAVAAVIAGPPALVLMDVQMPVMDGLEATRRIRGAGFADLPILAFTAPATPEDRARIDGCGMSGLLAKPVEMAALAATLGRWLPLAAAGPEAATLPDALRGALALTGQIDPDAALAMADGDPALLTERLRGFVDMCAQTAEDIGAALEEGDTRRAVPLFLSLRLPCREIAAAELARDAHTIGLCLRRADPGLNRADAYLARFEGFLAQLSEAAYG